MFISAMGKDGRKSLFRLSQLDASLSTGAVLLEQFILLGDWFKPFQPTCSFAMFAPIY